MAAIVAILDLELDDAGTEDVSGHREPRPPDAIQSTPAIELRFDELPVHRLGVVGGVQRRDARGVLTLLLQTLDRPAGVFLVNVCRVRQKDLGERHARRGGVDGALEPTAHQQRQAAAVIDMGVRQQHHIDPRRVERKRRTVALVPLLAALDHAAIQQPPAGGGFDQMAGAGNLARRTVKGDTHRRLSTRRPHPAPRGGGRGLEDR